MVVGPVEHKTGKRFRNRDDFDSYINAIDFDYGSEEVTFTCNVWERNTLQFKVFKRSAYAKSVIYKNEIVWNHGRNLYIPTSGMCFIRFNNNFTNKDYTEEFRDFIRKEKYRPGVLTSARIQPFYEKDNINIGCFGGTTINVRNITQRKISLIL